MANERTISQNLAQLLEELGLSEKPITINLTPQDLTRIREVNKYIQTLQQANERTANSTLRFSESIYLAA